MSPAAALALGVAPAAADLPGGAPVDPDGVALLILLAVGLAAAGLGTFILRRAGTAPAAGALLQPALRRAPPAAAAVLAVALVSIGCVRAFEAAAAPLAVVLVGGLAGLGILALAVARYDAAVAIGFLLMGVVEIEPAPPDAVFGLIIAVAIATGRFRPSRAPVAILVALAALAFLNVASTLASIDLFAAVRFGAITLYLVLFSLWLTGWMDRSRRARLVMVTWLVVAVLSSLVGIAVVYLGFPGRAILMDGTQTRANVLFEDANVYGPFLVPIAAVLLEERLRPRLLRLSSGLSALLFTILALGTLVSFSRAGWLNFAVTIVVMLLVLSLRRGGGRRAMRMLVMLTVTAIAAAGVMAAAGAGSFLQERAQLQSYDTNRFSAQRAGLDLSLRHPLGVGPGQFQFHHPVESHSTYVRVLAEQGVPGFLVWLVVAIATLVLAVQNAIRGRDTFGIGSAALLGSWCGLLVNSIVVDTLHWRHLWVVAALVWAGSLRDQASSGR